MERHRRSCYGGDRFLKHGQLPQLMPSATCRAAQHQTPSNTQQPAARSGQQLPLENPSDGFASECLWWDTSLWAALLSTPKGGFLANSKGRVSSKFPWCVCVHTQSLQSCPTLWAPMDCRPPGSSVHGILQTRILEWVAMPFSGASPPPSDQTHVSCGCCIADWFFTVEPLGKLRHWCGISWILFRVNLLQHRLDLSFEGWELFLGFLFQPQS